jgi:hypothetical protein
MLQRTSCIHRRISAYQNTQALFGAAVAARQQQQQQPGSSATLDLAEGKRRKPVPLPRSKIPAAAPAANEVKEATSSTPKEVRPQRPRQQGRRELAAAREAGNAAATAPAPSASSTLEKTVAPSKAGSSLHARFFSKRSKTDLGSDGLAAYKARRPGGAKYPAPKVPGDERRPEPRQRRSEGTTERRAAAARTVKQDSEGSLTRLPETPVALESRLKPEVRDKPLFSTFRSHLANRTQSKQSPPVSSKTSGSAAERSSPSPPSKKASLAEHSASDDRRKRRLSKTASESDIILRIREEGEDEAAAAAAAAARLTGHRVVEHVSATEPVSITVNSDGSSSPAGGSLRGPPLPDEPQVAADPDPSGTHTTLVISTPLASRYDPCPEPACWTTTTKWRQIRIRRRNFSRPPCRRLRTLSWEDRSRCR